jgi:predicted Zn-dependent protease with MMP-like domain
MQISMLRTVFLLALCMTSSYANGGSWSAGGAEIIGDTHNPWFLQNTKNVRYCIRGDYNHFSLSPEQIQNKVMKVFQYWAHQFSIARRPIIDGVSITLANQNFVEDQCRGTIEQALDTHDIVIQLGEISDVQRKFLIDPTRYLAVEVRTEYDVGNLRGKGFIYVSPDSGSLKYKKISAIENAWSVDDGLLFERVLTHEFGHIFGLQHTGLTRIENLMSAGYPEFAVSTEGSRQILANKKIPDVMTMSGTYEDGFKDGYCWISQEVRDFYDIPTDLKCLVYKLALFSMEIWGKTHLTGEPVKIGYVSFDNLPTASGEQLAQINITPAQNVFSNIPAITYDMGFIPAAFFAEDHSQGFYIPENRNGIKRWVAVSTGPNSLQIDGIMNEKIVRLHRQIQNY